MRKIGIVLMLIVFPVLAYAFEAPDARIEGNIYHLTHLERQVDAVDNDMYLFYGWAPEKKEEWKQASEDAVKELESIKNDLAGLDMHEDIVLVRDQLIVVINRLQEIYDGMQDNDTESIVKEYEQLRGADWPAYHELMLKKIVKYVNPQHIAEKLFTDDFDRRIIDVIDIDNKQDQSLYAEVRDLLAERKFLDAYKHLVKLREKYHGKKGESAIVLRLADCFASYDSTITDYVQEQEPVDGLDLYEQIIEKNEYSPVLAEAFIKWRTAYQVMNHGLSNFSKIPNGFYNEKRWELVGVVQDYLKEHPEDLWARWQIFSLLDIDNIKRGGEYGNTNLNYVGALFMDLDKDNEKE